MKLKNSIDIFFLRTLLQNSLIHYKGNEDELTFNQSIYSKEIKELQEINKKTFEWFTESYDTIEFEVVESKVDIDDPEIIELKLDKFKEYITSSLLYIKMLIEKNDSNCTLYQKIKAISKMLLNKSEAEQYNSPNGWGTYPNALKFLILFCQECVENGDFWVAIDR